VHCSIKCTDALQLQVLSTHWLFAAKGEGDVNIIFEAEELADALSELLEPGTTRLDLDPKESEVR
jgi:hypothetical protein